MVVIDSPYYSEHIGVLKYIQMYIDEEKLRLNNKMLATFFPRRIQAP